MLRIDEVIVVEGKYDRIKLSRFLDATILETSGFGIFHDSSLRELLAEAAKKRGLVVLTDSDNAGFQIRRYLRSFIDDSLIKNVYVPVEYGKEKRKKTASSSGILGVEGLREETIIKALMDSGVSVKTEPKDSKDRVSVLDLYRLGLSGRKNSRKKLNIILKHLGLPEQLSAKEVLEAVSLLKTKDGFISFCEEHADELSAMD